MSSLRVAQEISKDGKRKAVIEELRASLCKVDLFYDDFCAMEMIVYDNIFELDKKKMKSRKYIQLIDDFIKSGFKGKSLSNVVNMVNYGTNFGNNCNIEFHFSNELKVEVYGSAIDYYINIDGEYIKSPYSLTTRCTYDKLNSMSLNELLELSNRWNVFSYKNDARDGIGNPLCYFEYNGYTFYAYKEVLDGMQRTEYLKRINFLKTKSLLKLDNIPDEMKKELARSKILGLNKKIMILYFNEDATPAIKVL